MKKKTKKVIPLTEKPVSHKEIIENMYQTTKDLRPENQEELPNE